MLRDEPHLSTLERQHRLLHDIYVLLYANDYDTLRRVGLTPNQFTILRLLDTERGLKLIDLADRLIVARSTITHIIDTMEASEWVLRINDPEDRRAQCVTLTATGVELRDRAEALHYETLTRHLGTLDDRDQGDLARILESLRAAMKASHDAIKAL